MKLLLFFSLLLLPLAALGAPITVHVIDEAGAPVEGAMVQVQRFDGVAPMHVVATTDAAGDAKFDVGAASFEPKFFGRVAAWKEGRAVAGTNLVGPKANLTLEPGAQVSGTLEDEQGFAAGATVSLQRIQDDGNYLFLVPDSPLGQKLSALTDAKGAFVLQGVPADAKLELSLRGERYASQRIEARSGEMVKVKLRPGAILRGQVTDVAGAPLAGLRVLAQPQTREYNDAEVRATTGADGFYRLTGLTGGTYNVIFDAAPDAAYVVAAHANVSAVAGETRELESARAVAGVLVRGRVLNAQTKAGIAGIAVGVYGPTQPRASVPTQAFTTDEKGDFSARVAPGANSFYVLNSPQQWETLKSPASLELSAETAAPTVTLELTPAIPLRGRIVDEAGNGVQTRLTLKQEYREWPLESDENGEFSVYTAMKGAVKIGRSMFERDENEDPPSPWELVQEQTFNLPSTEPLRLVVRRTQMGALSGKVEDENGAPIAGVSLNVSVANGKGIGSTSQWKAVVSDAQGRFELPNVRADQTVELRGVEKTGYDLQGDTEITRDGNDWKLRTVTMRARAHQLAGRITLADGAPAAGAMVFAAGSETRADANGAYLLKVLPQGNVEVMVYAARQFGFRSAPTVLASDSKAVPLDLKLAPQPLQPTDRELAGDMFDRARVLAAQNNTAVTDRLRLRDADADPVAALEALIAAPDTDKLSMAIYGRAGDPNVPTPLLLRAVGAITDMRERLYAGTMLYARRSDWPDDAATQQLVASLLRDAQTIAADPNGPNQWMATIGLMSVAPLAERYEGEAAGRAALERGIAWVKAKDPQPGNGNTDGYLATFAAVAEPIAMGSPALFARLLEAIDVKTSSAYTRSLAQGTEAIAKTRGLEAAVPFLRQLGEAPTENDDAMRGGMNHGVYQATRKAIEVGGADAPALALQLARGLGADNYPENESARALAEAAFYQPPAVAAALWKEALPEMMASHAAQIAARVGAKQPTLGAELLEIARQKLEKSDRVSSGGSSLVAAFAFHEANADAARARYRLEKAWWELEGQTDDFQLRPDMVRAMATIDGERAFEWASLLPETQGRRDARVDALRSAALYIEADDRSRADLDFERWARDSTIFIK